MNHSLLALAALWLPLAAYCQQPPALSPRNANYQIDVRLNPATRQLDGQETLIWRNTTTDRITELQFHLYLNAFKDQNSTFMRESGGQLRGVEMDKSTNESPYGWINIKSMKRRGSEGRNAESRNAEPLSWQFIQPDDQATDRGNRDDRTVIRVPLSRAVGPGESITLDIAFQARLPKIFARTGYSRDFYLVGQWFPKIGVYEGVGTRYRKTQGGWNCHQFHAHSEFYADYGQYDVNITTPSAYWVEATGLMTGETANRDGTKTLRYRATDVVDFAWTASPHFQAVTDHWKRPGGGVVTLTALMQPEHLNQAQRHLDAAKIALTYFDKHLGQYPFPNLTIVDPPAHASGAAGMEYPTFITAGTVWGLPAGIRAPEIVTVHEFGHQYFMQLLATNEFEEAWMDEGFNQYYEGRIMDEAYGAKTAIVNWLGYRIGDLEFSRDSYVHLDNPAISPAFGNVWQLPDACYGDLTYMKTATWMRTLEGLVGRTVMDEIMQTYFIRWRFKHPNAENFIAIVNELVPKRLGTKFGSDMNWFFRQVLYGDQVCDYKLVSIHNRKPGKGQRSTIRVDRLGDMQLPVEVLVHFSDGHEQLLHWNGQSRSQTFSLTQPTTVQWAKLDPQQKIYLDTNLNNNSLTLNPSSAPAAKFTGKFLFWLQNLMQWLG